MKNNRFRFLTVLIVPLLIFMLAGTAFASGKSYSVPYAHFDAVLNADGSADITETWTVRYSGEFSRFYKDITYQNTEEKFSDVEILGVKINGNACEPTDDTAGRPDYHYNLSSGTGTRTLTAYLHTTGTTEYEFRYRLKDAVKQVDEDYYIFSYRYIGANFEQSVSDISVTVTAPDKCVMKTLYYTSGTENVDETSAVVSGGSGKGVFKVKVRMDAPEGTTLFTHAAPITAGQLENPKNENSSGFFTFLTVMFFILTVMSLFFLPIVLWGGALNEKRAVRGSSKPSKNRLNKAKKDPAYVENTLRAMRSAMPDPLQFAAAVRGYWELKKEIDPGSTNAGIEAILARVRKKTDALLLPGAGGGGFVFMVAKSAAAARRIRADLEANPPNKAGRFFDFALDTGGLKVTIL